jgi:hypothetical protein
VLQGAELLFYPTAIGSEPSDPTLDSFPQWQRVMQGHAAANLVPVVASNRTGARCGVFVQRLYPFAVSHREAPLGGSHGVPGPLAVGRVPFKSPLPYSLHVVYVFRMARSSFLFETPGRCCCLSHIQGALV